MWNGLQQRQFYDIYAHLCKLETLFAKLKATTTDKTTVEFCQDTLQTLQNDLCKLERDIIDII